MLIKKIIKFFDRLEDKIRGRLSHHPILYAIVGGIGVVLFWRGVWHTADDINLGSVVSLVLGTIILLITGVFVSAFVGNRLIVSGLIDEKKLSKKEETEIKIEEVEIETEEMQLRNLQNTLNRVEKKISELGTEIEKK